MLRSFYTIFTKKDNILSLISILLVLTIMIADIFGDGFDNGTMFEIILVILGLISVSQIIEREDRFEKVHFNLNDIKTKISELTRPPFISLEQLTPFKDTMKNSYELFYTGGHLHSFIHSHSNIFEEWLKEGKSIRLILQNPKNKGLNDLEMPCVNYKAHTYTNQINDSLDILKKLNKKYPEGKLGVKVTNVVPTQSVSIIDGHMGGSSLCMLHHLPNGESSSAPFMCLDPYRDKEWFILFYERYYVYLWKASKVIIQHPDDKL